MEYKDLSMITTYKAGAWQASMHRNLQKRCDEILKPFGISKMNWMIVGHILDAGSKGIRISDLASKLGTTNSYLTTAINLLESKGFVVRSNNDKDSRSKLISINKEFVPKCELIEKTLRQGLRETIYLKVDPSEFRIYMKVLQQLNAEGNQEV